MAKPVGKTSVAVNTPARVDIDVNKTKAERKRTVPSPVKASRPRRDETSEYRTRYKPPAVSQSLKSPKGFRQERIDEQVKHSLQRMCYFIPPDFFRNERSFNGQNVPIRTTKVSVEMWN